MEEAKKNLLTYAGLRKLEDELHDLKVVKRKKLQERLKRPESRETFLRTLSTMQLKMSREISRHVSRRSRRSLRMPRL